MSQFRPYLGGYSASYRNAEVADERANIPDGVYEARINKYIVRTAQNGSHYIMWELNVELPPDRTALIRKNNYLSDSAMPMLKRDLKALGIDPDAIMPFDRIYDVLDYLVGAVVEFEQRTTPNKSDPTKRPFVNCDFQRLITPSGKAFPDLSQQIVDEPPKEQGFTDVSDNDELPF